MQRTKLQISDTFLALWNIPQLKVHFKVSLLIPPEVLHQCHQQGSIEEI